jgi:hypothetical protein
VRPPLAPERKKVPELGEPIDRPANAKAEDPAFKVSSDHPIDNLAGSYATARACLSLSHHTSGIADGHVAAASLLIVEVLVPTMRADNKIFLLIKHGWYR